MIKQWNAHSFKIHRTSDFTRKRFIMFKNKLGEDSPIPKYTPRFNAEMASNLWWPLGGWVQGTHWRLHKQIAKCCNILANLGEIIHVSWKKQASISTQTCIIYQKKSTKQCRAKHNILNMVQNHSVHGTCMQNTLSTCLPDVKKPKAYKCYQFIGQYTFHHPHDSTLL